MPGRRSRPGVTRASWSTPATPTPPPLFVGREPELQTLRAGLRRVSVALIYGVGGVGKSALAYRVAADWTHPVLYRRVTAGDSLAAVVDDLRRTLAHGGVVADCDAGLELQALSAEIDASRALVIIDDLHVLPGDDAARVVAEPARTLTRGRLVATSRERIPRGDGGDRIELSLASLDRDSAGKLWRTLDDLYGPSTGFDRAFDASTGNPLLLRRCHAGELMTDEPVLDLVGPLDPAEQHAAGLLALAALRIPASPFIATLPGDGRQIVASLVRKMIVQSDASGLAIHDVFCDALKRALSSDVERALHRQLAALVIALDIDPVVRGREVARHLGAAGEWGASGDFLVAAGSEFIRLGAARDLLRAYDAIPGELRSRPVAIARARTLGRAGNLQQACDELERLRVDHTQEPELELALAQAAMLVGRLELAGAAAARALAQPLTPKQRWRAQVIHALILTHLGRGDDARKFLEAAELSESQAKHRAHLALTRAFTLFVDEQLGAGEAASLIERARVLYDSDAVAYQATALALPLVAAVLAREGHARDARAAIDAIELLVAGRLADALLLHDVQFLRGGILFDLGERHESLKLFAANEHAFVARGNILGARLAAVWRARVLLVLGRVEEGRALLAEVSRTGAELPSIRRAVERSQIYDPLRATAAGPVPPPLVVRQRMIDAVVAAAAGDRAGVHKRLRGVSSAVRGPGHALDRALFHLVRARLASALGDRKAAMHERRRAEVEAADEADPGVVTQLAAAIGLAAVEAREPIVLDVAAEALRCGRQSIALAQRPALRQLLYLLANAGTVDKTTLATALWGAAYKPATHDNALWVNMTRLRKLVSPIGLTVQTNDTGYRLVAPAELVVVGDLPPRGPSKA